ncbi:TPA: hypothetical protein ACPJZQ_004467 [Vibrio alginolyticus]
MPSFSRKFRRWADTAAAYVIGTVLIGGSLWGLFGPELKPKVLKAAEVTPEMALYHAVMGISPAVALDFMLNPTMGHTLKESSACMLAGAFAARAEESERQESVRLTLLHQHTETCRIGLQLREATLPQLEAITVTGELLPLLFYFELFNTVMQKNEWDKIGPFSDETVCEQFAAQTLAAGFDVRSCKGWAPAF